MRVLGLDYGSKRIGVALGDTESRIASPWAVITDASYDEAVQRIRDIVQAERVHKIIVGIPRPLQNREHENPQMQAVRSFVHMLQAHNLDVEEEDEVLTSRLAVTQMRERGQKGKRDDLAAANILQSWLDRHAVSP